MPNPSNEDPGLTIDVDEVMHHIVHYAEGLGIEIETISRFNVTNPILVKDKAKELRNANRANNRR